MPHEFFAPVPKGLAGVLAEELVGLGAVAPRTAAAGVAFAGSLELAYRACLWSRVASRVLLVLTQAEAADAEGLYAAVRTVPWHEHLGPDDTLAVDFTGTSGGINNTRFGALKAKDAIVDQIRERCGRRPSIDTSRPSVRANLHLEGRTVVICVDLSGEPLHRRGYRAAGIEAPLKENLAAAVLLLAGWPAVGSGGPLVDPMCGSGTLLLEGAMLAADVAPGIDREYFGFLGWRGHDPATWNRLLAEAAQRRADGGHRAAPALGYDADPRAVTAARANARRAGLAHLVQVEHRSLSEWTEPRPWPNPGLVVANPPYGQRLGEAADLTSLYRQLGQVLAAHFASWPAAVLAQSPPLFRALGVRASQERRLFNGALECRLFLASIPAGQIKAASESMFANRLRKNLRTRSRWARRCGVTCYRLYDADMPEYAVAVDVYQAEELWAHLQEYQAPRTVDPDRAAARLQETLEQVAAVLQLPPARVVLKVRQRQRGPAQYGKQGSAGILHPIQEGGLTFLVNLTDYLDTGLFLDHRETRALLRSLAKGRAFLNLFAYTGTATVYAAAGGSPSTTTVDLSRTYLDWARRNLEANGLAGPQHQFVQADCRVWLAEPRTERYGLIFLDPPTFSNSKRMTGDLDLQRDHVELIQCAAALLAPEGVLVFSTNHQRFTPELDRLAGLSWVEITRQTVPLDFAGRTTPHRSWQITRGSG